MLRTFYWIMGICAFCAMLFFRSASARGGDRTTAAFSWRYSGDALAWTYDETPLPRTYAEARAQSLRTGLPLVVWVGNAVCPVCVQRTRGQYVHWVTDSFPDTPKDALVVGVQDGGDLTRIGTMTAWPDGHITTINKALDLWRTHKQVTDQRGIAYRGAPVYQPTYNSGYSSYSGYQRSYVPIRSRGRSGCAT